MTHNPEARLSRLLAYLDSDPSNPNLLRDATQAALDAGDTQRARALLARLQKLGQLSDSDLSLSGVAAMQAQDFDAARAIFTQLYETHPHESAVRFNLAWSIAMAKDFAGADALLDQATVRAIPQAAMLKVQITHQLGDVETAAEIARNLLEHHPSDTGLLAAASVVAIDNEDLTLADDYAQRAGDHADALTTRGMIALDEQRNAEAASLFARALEQAPNTPRAWIGAGLTKMLAGETAQAAEEMTRGAEAFGTHVGSWVGVGWAHLIADNLEGARAAFERAMDLDRSFGETHGSLAVIDLLQGKLDEARRGVETARRLNPHGFSAALASALIASNEQRPELAKKIIDRALHAPIDGRGRTIAHFLSRVGLGE